MHLAFHNLATQRAYEQLPEDARHLVRMLIKQGKGSDEITRVLRDIMAVDWNEVVRKCVEEGARTC